MMATQAGCTALRLPGFPVTDVTEVKIGGVVVAPTDYRLGGAEYLYARGTRRWPTTQNLAEPDTEPDTFSVAYTFGAIPDEFGLRAAAAYAEQIAYAWTPGKEDCCTIDFEVTQISRQGVTHSRRPAAPLKWRTGLKSVDMWLDFEDARLRNAGPAFVVPGKTRHYTL
jgi:hypothetical protein